MDFPLSFSLFVNLCHVQDSVFSKLQTDEPNLKINYKQTITYSISSPHFPAFDDQNPFPVLILLSVLKNSILEPLSLAMMVQNIDFVTRSSFDFFARSVDPLAMLTRRSEISASKG